MKTVSGLLLSSALVLPAVLPAAALHAQSADQSIEVQTAHNILDVGLFSHDPSTRVEAISATGMIGKSETVRKQIEGFLSDKDANVRIAATETLADLNMKASLPALENTLDNDEVPEVQFAAAKALYRMHDPKGKQALEDILSGKIKTKSSLLNKEKRRVISSFSSVHGASIFLLSTAGGLVPVPGAGMGLGAVAHLLNDSALSPRAIALLLIARERSPENDELLRTSLGDKDWTVRATAALLIALTARRDMRNDLIPLLDDNNQKVRFRAAGAYLHLTPEGEKQAP